MHWSLRHRPSLSAISRPEDPRHFGAAGAEPNIICPLHRDRGITGSERAFSRQTRCARWLPPLPCRTTGVGQENPKAPLHRIAKYDAMLAIPERNRIKKHAGGLLFKYQHPILAAIGGSVDSRQAIFSFARTHHERRVRIPGPDAAKIKLLRSRHAHHGPRLPAVKGTNHRAACSAGPYDVTRSEEHTS